MKRVDNTIACVKTLPIAEPNAPPDAVLGHVPKERRQSNLGLNAAPISNRLDGRWNVDTYSTLKVILCT